MQFTIESRELTNPANQRPIPDAEPNCTTIDAATADDAITEFVRKSDSELVSFLKPAECRESIATVRKNDTVFLVRVYTA